jgi:hypothetical protein
MNSRTLFSSRGGLLIDDKVHFGRGLRPLNVFVFFYWWVSFIWWFICFLEGYFCVSRNLTGLFNWFSIRIIFRFLLMVRGLPVKVSFLVNNLGSSFWSFLRSHELFNCGLRFAEGPVMSIWCLYLFTCNILLLITLLVDLSCQWRLLFHWWFNLAIRSSWFVSSWRGHLFLSGLLTRLFDCFRVLRDHIFMLFR